MLSESALKLLNSIKSLKQRCSALMIFGTSTRGCFRFLLSEIFSINFEPLFENGKFFELRNWSNVVRLIIELYLQNRCLEIFEILTFDNIQGKSCTILFSIRFPIMNEKFIRNA